ncbi:DUF1861 family protein [Clostridium botulinum]|uniref:DUF1861 family protein n=1 Tax=Clostridium botulinum TaxID=1491 RepID=UPI002247BAAE|nr:DUF1861 family protein [Clostridium botulinum]UZP05137.1 DUF1861 family protein [Clostridium botulinum]UZP08524.1 DUF1861 family protein [Clostridium botulinum]UZP11875.1 DUF1861 family protein [Clostridium botulinum]
MKDMKTCEILLAEYLKSESKIYGVEKINFINVGENDVYNISAPFVDNDKTIIAGRVEARDSEHSTVYFFEKNDEGWSPIDSYPTFSLQDPFFTKINNELIVGGVEIFPHPEIEGTLKWRTIFYKGKDVASLQRFFVGPDGMKDLRLVQLLDKRIGVLTRPQGEKGGRGKIGFSIINTLEELNIKVIEESPLLDGLFVDEEWGGANEARPLNETTLGILGHVACFDKDGNRHYYPMTFELNINTLEVKNQKLIAVRKDFKPGQAKRADLEDVVFSGGLEIKEDKATLYAGISDAEAQFIIIDNPFK